ncbi:MAG: DUF2804 domain-containing protein [Clostridia bacterium]
MNEILNKTELLDENGRLISPGFSKRENYVYNKENIKAFPLRVKEWDFYQIISPKYVLQMTIGHVSYMANFACTLFDFQGNRFSVSKFVPFPRKLSMDKNGDEKSCLNVKYKNFEMKFDVFQNYRQLQIHAIDKKFGKVDIDVTLEMSGDESIVVATPFEKENEFYLNQKISCMKTSGVAKFGDNLFEFDKVDSFALLDWGRGVLPFKHNWVWGNGSGVVDGNSFGFNIGSFGDTSNATENALFFNGKTHKIDSVTANVDKSNFLKPCIFHSSDNRFEVEFTPIFDNFTQTKLLFVNNSCHQVFGNFNGTCILDDGKKIELKNFLAFCEFASNRW